jgi:L-arabinose isomerase
VAERSANGDGLRVGLFGIGLDTYWPQFAGLEDRLKGYLAKVAAKLQRPGVEVVSLGLIDSPEKAAVAGHRFRQADVDLIFLYVTTYALSATVLPVVRRAKVPVIVLNLSPGAAIDYRWFNALGDRTKMTGEWLAYCQSCSVPEIANVFRRADISFHQITGMLDDDPQAWDEISDWIEAARVAYVMEHNRLGVMGHYYGGMLDIYSDLTQQCAGFGGHVEIVEVDELAALRREVTAGQARDRVAHFRKVFDVQPDCPEEELDRAAPTPGGPPPVGGRPTASAPWRTTTWAWAPPRTRTPSARSSSATACSPRAGSPWPARWRSRTSRP